MAATAQLTDDYHLSLSIGKGLWDDLVGAALPLKVKDGTFDLGKAVVSGVKQIGARGSHSARDAGPCEGPSGSVLGRPSRGRLPGRERDVPRGGRLVHRDR